MSDPDRFERLVLPHLDAAYNLARWLTRDTHDADSYLGVLTAQTDLYNAQLALIAARVNRLTNLVDLYRSLGGGWIQRTGEEPRAALRSDGDSGLCADYSCNRRS